MLSFGNHLLVTHARFTNRENAGMILQRAMMAHFIGEFGRDCWNDGEKYNEQAYAATNFLTSVFHFQTS